MSSKRGKAAPGKGMMKTKRGLPIALVEGTRKADPASMKAAVLKAMGDDDIFTITRACKRAGIATRSYYKWLEKDAEFKAAVEIANEEITQRLEQSAHEQAVGIGVEAPVASLMVFLLKSRRPLVYREATEAKVDLTSPNGGNLSFTLSLGDRGE